MKIRSIKQLKNLKNKKVLVRVDYNVQIIRGKVLDDERIERSFSTINYLLKQKAKVILISHLGRPDGKVVKKFSLAPIAKYLNNFTKNKVYFVNDCIGKKVQKSVAGLEAGQILLLENLRFYAEEENNSAIFAKELAGLADIYVNSAFSNSHREHASMVGIPKYLPAYAGLNLVEEIKMLDKALTGFRRPGVAILGGAKISTKIKLIENLLKKYDYLLIGGALVNNFFAAQKINIGKSFFEKDQVKLAARLLTKYNDKIILPIDVRIAKTVSKKAKVESLSLISLAKLKRKDFQIVDIGQKTQIFFESYITRAKTIIWNGPMGIFEIENFRQGSDYIAQKFCLNAKGPSYGVAGGGETVAILDEIGLKKWPDFVSTGGGAMLKYLEGNSLPAIKALKIKK